MQQIFKLYSAQEESRQEEHVENCAKLVDPSILKIFSLISPPAATHFLLNLLLEYGVGSR